MRRPTIATFLLLAFGSQAARAGEFALGERTFRVPDGYLVEKVAGPPLVDRPIVADVDERGRLYVADSSGSNDKVQKQLEDRTHRIVRLEDTDGDGRYDRSTVFADRMMFPEGSMWLDGSLYVAAPPSIWKLTDTDDDGVADRREEWFQGKTLTGCANDLHGPYAGLDGRIYWCKGAFASQTYERPGRKPMETRASHIFRAKTDGTEIEPVMTGGMDNPVEIAFTPEGERIFTTTFLQHPGGGFRDGLIHALYGGLYGKDHDVINNHPRTRPELLPPLVHLGPAAPSGLTRAWSEEVDSPDMLFATCFNLRKITRHALTPKDGSYAATTEDFVTSNHLDFHPTDVLEDRDGSLLFVDTGGWYKLCCPTSQIVKPDVLGGIYRVRRAEPSARVGRGGGWKELDWKSMTPLDLASLLDAYFPADRKRAIADLARLGDPALEEVGRVVAKGDSVQARLNLVWAACRVDSAKARALVRSALDDSASAVRQAAAHAAGLWRDREATARLIALLEGPDAQVARASAEALGRIDDPSAIRSLLKVAGSSPAWALVHSATYALIEIDDPAATRADLAEATPGATRAGLIALDQMDNGGLTPESLPKALASTDAGLRDAAWWIAGRHPEWGDALAAFFRGRLASPGDLPELETRLAAIAKSGAIQSLIAEELANPRTSAEVRLALLRTIGRSGLKETPGPWIEALTRALDDPSTTAQAVSTARAIPIRPEKSRPLARALIRVAGSENQPADVRLGALAAVPGGLPDVAPETFAFLMGELAPDRPVSARTTAADVLARAKLLPAQFPKLAEALAKAGPLETGRLLDAFDKAQGEEIGRTLVAALLRSPARSTLQFEALKPKLARFGPGLAEASSELYRAIEADSSDRRGHLESLLANLSGGDVRRGQQVFNGAKAACVTCHAIGYVGGKLGPDLTKIGQVRAERDLLEAIVYPSASFVRSYEPISVATREGLAFSGILRKDAPDEVILAVAADKEERISRDRIEEIAPGTTSVMPAGLDRQLSPAELADLVAFLKACR